jgi:hypothetical protein
VKVVDPPTTDARASREPCTERLIRVVEHVMPCVPAETVKVAGKFVPPIDQSGLPIYYAVRQLEGIIVDSFKDPFSN